MARLQLVRILCDLGVSLDAIGQLLAGRRRWASCWPPTWPPVAPMAGGFTELLGRRDGPAFRRWLVEELDAHTGPRAGP